MELWGKKKITVAECVSVWDEGTVYVCENEQGRICFVQSCGVDIQGKEPIGSRHATHHDQTLVSKGFYKIINYVEYRKQADGTVALKSDLPFDRNLKASLAVFK
jgi:hypothetical protein